MKKYIKYFVLVLAYYASYNVLLYYGFDLIEKVNINLLPYLNICVYGALLLVFGTYFWKTSNSDTTNKKTKVSLKLLLVAVLLSIFYRFIEDPIFRFNEIVGNTEIPNVKSGNSILSREIPIFIYSVIILPILEEIIFRGIILRGIIESKKVLFPLLFSAFLFMLIHINVLAFEKSIPNMISSFLFGLLLGYLYLKTEKLIYPIILHGLSNFIWYFFRIKSEFYWDTIKSLDFNILYFGIVLFSCLSSIILLFWLGRIKSIKLNGHS